TTMETLTEESDVEQRESEAREAGEESVAPGGGTIIIDKTDKEAPAISNIQTKDITTDSARISWETNEPGIGFVELGQTTDYSESEVSNQSDTSHNVLFNNLISNTTYNYRINALDSWGNMGVSENNTFKTLSLSEEQEEKLEETEGEDESGLSFEDIENMTEEEKAQTAQELFDVANESTQKALKLLQNAQGEATLSNLEETLMLQYENIAQFANDLPAPLLSGEPRVITTAKSAIIIWRTDKDSNSLIALAPEGEYNSRADNPYTQVTGNPEERVTEHRVEINRLNPDTLYHYQLRSKADIGPLASSRDFTFRTQKEILEIRNYTVDKVSDQKAAFKWTTNVEADTKIRYTPYRDNQLSVEEEKTKENQAVTTIHNLTLENLEGGVNYEVELISSDLEGNTARRKISSFSTTEDNYPPVIKQIETESAIAPGGRTQVQSIISWRTNELSTSRVYYTEGVVGPEAELTRETRLDDNYTKKHVVVLTDFKPGTPYSFRAESIDSSGNKTLSQINTILAPQREESVFELIFKNLEGIFGWVGEMRR
ncbi:MAG TPA: fibronectin type III domain-containing protein, partial [Patescibacteria group bacterium]|nr:fibronectin type III domain-containing protein [Patescibacteria group bacterium]